MIEFTIVEFALNWVGTFVVGGSVGFLIERAARPDVEELKRQHKEAKEAVDDRDHRIDGLVRDRNAIAAERNRILEALKAAQARASESDTARRTVEDECQNKLQRVITAANLAAEALERALEEATS